VIFLDTSFLFPLVYTQDEDHERVREVFDTYRSWRLRDLILTTNHVVMETITMIRMRVGHREAMKAGELYRGKLARIHWATPEEERAAFDYFARHRDKKYSMVDCLSFVMMERLGMREALAVDSDFTHRFIARPGPREP
jgi:hypothetical protein